MAYQCVLPNHGFELERQLGTMRKGDSEAGKRHKLLHLEYMADSAKQIADSIDRTSLRDKLDEAFQAAIARAGSQCQERTSIERVNRNVGGQQNGHFRNPGNEFLPAP
jgi:hypothetical protein